VVASQRIQARDDAGLGGGDSPLPWGAQSKNTAEANIVTVTQRRETIRTKSSLWA
jgi:hypothetical protein